VATRKDAVKKQVDDFLAPVLRPDEATRGGAMGQSGPMPGLFGLVGMAFIKQYYVALTSQRVIFVRCSQLSGKPLQVDFEDERDGVSAQRRADGRFWSLMTYVGSRTVKLRYHKLWREEMDVVIHALGGEDR
jgi:hypothetical protein